MSETLANAQFDMLEAAYNEVPIEAKARIAELERERDEWKAKAEGYAEALEKLGCSVFANGTVFEPSGNLAAQFRDTRNALDLARISELKRALRGRDALIRDMARELRSLNDGGISTDCIKHERRMRGLGIEVDDD